MKRGRNSKAARDHVDYIAKLNAPRMMTDDEIRAYMTLWRDQQPQIIAIWAALSAPPRVMVLGDLYEFDYMVLGDSDLAPDFSCPLWLWGSPGWTS